MSQPPMDFSPSVPAPSKEVPADQDQRSFLKKGHAQSRTPVMLRRAKEAKLTLANLDDSLVNL